MIEKFQSTGLVVDMKHITRAHSGRSEQEITAVESVGESPWTSIRHRPQELNI